MMLLPYRSEDIVYKNQTREGEASSGKLFCFCTSLVSPSKSRLAIPKVEAGELVLTLVAAGQIIGPGSFVEDQARSSTYPPVVGSSS